MIGKLFGKSGAFRAGAGMAYDRFGSDLITQYDQFGSIGLATADQSSRLLQLQHQSSLHRIRARASRECEADLPLHAAQYRRHRRRVHGHLARL